MNRDDFQLSKAKYLVSKGAVEYQANVVIQKGDNYLNITRGDKVACDPHEDFISLFKNLKPMLAQMHGLTDSNVFITEKRFKVSDKQTELFKNYQKEKEETLVVVTGITVTGSEENKGCIISGTYKGQAINTLPIKYSGTAYGFESELSKIVDKIEDEVFELIENLKMKELDVNFGDGDEDLGLDLSAEGVTEKDQELA